MRWPDSMRRQAVGHPVRCVLIGGPILGSASWLMWVLIRGPHSQRDTLVDYLFNVGLGTWLVAVTVARIRSR